MSTAKIQQKAKFINNERGKPVEVILPYKMYRKLLDLQTSIEIYQEEKTQKSIQRAKEDMKKGNFATFKNVDEAIEWLEK